MNAFRPLSADVAALSESLSRLLAGPLTREQAQAAYEIAARLDVMRQRLETVARMKASLTAVARHFTFVRETQGANRGAWVQFFQRVAGGQPGDPWCCFFLCRVLDIAYFGHSPLIVTGSCAELLANVRAKGYDLKPSSAVQPDDHFFLPGRERPGASRRHRHAGQSDERSRGEHERGRLVVGRGRRLRASHRGGAHGVREVAVILWLRRTLAYAIAELGVRLIELSCWICDPEHER
jgi:hypothetical protein